MKLIYTVTALFLICGTISCLYVESEFKHVEVQAIEYEQDLTSVKHSFEEVTTFLNPGDIVNVSDEYLIISDADSDGFIKVFSIPELEYLYSWGQQGSGPNEFQFIPLNEINTQGKNIILYEIGTRHLRKYEVSDTTLVPINEVTLQYEGQTNPISGITKIHEELYIAEHGIDLGDSNYEFIAIQPNNDTPLFKFGNYPSTELNGYEKLFEYLKTTDAADDGSKIAAFYLYHNKFKVFDHQGGLLNKFTIIDDTVSPEDRELVSFQYRSIKSASNDFLYLMAMHEYRDKIEEKIETFRPAFEKWDWNGNPLNRSKFDVPVHNFVVSEKHGKIYAYSVLDIHSIYEFDLP